MKLNWQPGPTFEVSQVADGEKYSYEIRFTLSVSGDTKWSVNAYNHDNDTWHHIGKRLTLNGALWVAQSWEDAHGA